MSGGFGAQTPAIASTASAFDAQADPIMQQAMKLESIKGSASTTGKAYAPQGQAYHDAITQSLEKIIRSFSEKSTWVSATLSAAVVTIAVDGSNAAPQVVRSPGLSPSAMDSFMPVSVERPTGRNGKRGTDVANNRSKVTFKCVPRSMQVKSNEDLEYH